MTHTIVPGHVQVTLCTSVLLSLGCAQHPRLEHNHRWFLFMEHVSGPMVASVVRDWP